MVSGYAKTNMGRHITGVSILLVMDDGLWGCLFSK